MACLVVIHRPDVPERSPSAAGRADGPAVHGQLTNDLTAAHGYVEGPVVLLVGDEPATGIGVGERRAAHESGVEVDGRE